MCYIYKYDFIIFPTLDQQLKHFMRGDYDRQKFIYPFLQNVYYKDFSIFDISYLPVHQDLIETF